MLFDSWQNELARSAASLQFDQPMIAVFFVGTIQRAMQQDHRRRLVCHESAETRETEGSTAHIAAFRDKTTIHSRSDSCKK
jgi:hypothetical protein